MTFEHYKAQLVKTEHKLSGLRMDYEMTFDLDKKRDLMNSINNCLQIKTLCEEFLKRPTLAEIPDCTPKNLDDAILQIFCMAPVNMIRERGYYILRDFMAQKFTVTLHKIKHEESLKIVEELFNELTKRE